MTHPVIQKNPPLSPIRFKAVFDNNALISTIFIILIFFGVAAFALTPSAFASQTARSLAIAGILIVLLFLANGKVRYYEITNSSVRIARLLNSIYVPLSRIENVVPTDGSALTGSARRMGSYGFFGYTGTFSNSKFGVMHWFMTNRSSLVYLQLVNNEIYFLSPSENLRFCQEIKNVISGAKS